ncbi:NAD(P)/FAD-dependent oxidoreductase [Rhizobium sp. PAMB 3182]
MIWQSPIAPGVSWYQSTVADRPEYPALDGSTSADVVIVGGGFTGLQAAYNLAKAGTRVVLIDAVRFGDGASGRNGGQMGTGHRAEVEELEKSLGFERAKALFDLAENAKKHLLGFAETHGIDIEYLPGQLNVAHKAGWEKEYRDHVEITASRYGYPHMSYMDRAETCERLGSKRYFCGIRDTGTGHIQPLKLLVGLARVAAAAGANLHEMTPARSVTREGGKIVVKTDRGDIRADRALIACNGYIGHLEPVNAARVMPIRSFIGATVPLTDYPEIIPGNEAIADSRFVVRYFRKSRDGRLLFGGREAYTSDNPRDITTHIRRQIAELYPQLKDVEMTHAWGGSVGITLPRQPFAREVMPGVTAIGGYSGHGVMLSNYCGKLFADDVLSGSGELDLLKTLKIPAFPGGSHLRKPLLFLALSWYALRDRF